ncbi:spidroin-1-like [Phoenix dactylifera]|uniref:Spidroin-1-like n=1 Tax=Phoenix dactylifera TaxID=42345 RepID=A0A8B8ZUT4_PHODC|nr:spidroin-1-like [Phoenix dactylifera]
MAGCGWVAAVAGRPHGMAAGHGWLWQGCWHGMAAAGAGRVEWLGCRLLAGGRAGCRLLAGWHGLWQAGQGMGVAVGPWTWLQQAGQAEQGAGRAGMALGRRQDKAGHGCRLAGHGLALAGRGHGLAGLAGAGWPWPGAGQARAWPWQALGRWPGRPGRRAWRWQAAGGRAWAARLLAGSWQGPGTGWAHGLRRALGRARQALQIFPVCRPVNTSLFPA